MFEKQRLQEEKQDGKKVEEKKLRSTQSPYPKSTKNTTLKPVVNVKTEKSKSPKSPNRSSERPPPISP